MKNLTLAIERNVSALVPMLTRARKTLCSLILLVMLLALEACGANGHAPPGGNDITEVEGIVVVNLASMQTGIFFDKMVSDDLISMLYTGDQAYDDSGLADSFDLDFSLGLDPGYKFVEVRE